MRKLSSSTTLSPSPSSDSVLLLNPLRSCDITGEGLTDPARTLWELKHGIWFMIQADRRLAGWMHNTEGVLTEPSLERFCRREHRSFQWLP